MPVMQDNFGLEYFYGSLSGATQRKIDPLPLYYWLDTFMHQRILILDYGSQVTQLIARRVREAGAYCEIHPGDVSDDFLRSQPNLKGVILSGSHASVYAEDALQVPAAVFDLGVPVLGICYGMQAMALHLGGKTEQAERREFGHAQVRAQGHTALLKDIQ